MIIVYLLTFFAAAVIIFFLFSFYLSYFRLLRGEAPFVPLPKEVLAKVVEALEMKDESVVFDLGCGDGRVLAACHEARPRAKFFGYEKNFVIFLLAVMKLKKIKKPHNIKILNKDFFLENISQATHIFTYLLPKPMSGLGLKLKGELRPGTRLVSCDFPLKSKEPRKIIELKSNKSVVVGKLYVYDF